MSLYGVGETYTYGFNTYNSSNALANADSLPTGTLVVNGTDAGTTVTIANLATGRYKVSVSLSGRTVGDELHVRVSASVGALAQEWRSPPFRIAFPAALTTGMLTSGTGTAQLSVTAGVALATLAAAGLDLIPADAPAGPPVTWPEQNAWLYRRFARADKSLTEITVKDSGGGVITTQAVSDDGAGNETLGEPT